MLLGCELLSSVKRLTRRQRRDAEFFEVEHNRIQRLASADCYASLSEGDHSKSPCYREVVRWIEPYPDDTTMLCVVVLQVVGYVLGAPVSRERGTYLRVRPFQWCLRGSCKQMINDSNGHEPGTTSNYSKIWPDLGRYLCVSTTTFVTFWPMLKQAVASFKLSAQLQPGSVSGIHWARKRTANSG